MARTSKRAVEQAAAEANQAAQTAQTNPSSQTETVHTEAVADPDRMEKLLQNRPSVKARADLEERYEKRQEEFRAPTQEPKNEEPTPEAKTEPVEAKTVPAPEAKVEEAAPETPAPKMVKAKVDGEELDVSEEEVNAAGGLTAWQKQKAADNRFEKARKISEQTQNQLAQVAQLLLNQNAPKPQPQQQPAEILKAKLDTIRFGTPEEASAAFSEALQAYLPKQEDPNAQMSRLLAAVDHKQALDKFRSDLPISEEASAAFSEALQAYLPKQEDPNAQMSRLLAAVDHKQALDKFRSDFPDIMSNQLLLKLAVSMEREEFANAQKNGKAIDWRETYSRIGNQIRSVVPQRQSQPATTPQTPSTPSSASAKEERKASITVLPTSSARAELPKEEKEPTREEARKSWIADQKKARGLN